MKTLLRRPAGPMDDSGGWRYVAGLGFVAILLIYGFPLYWMVSTSFKTLSEVSTLTWVPSSFNIEPYQAFFRAEFLPALRNSAIIATSTTVLSMLLAIPAAYGLSRVKSRLVMPTLLLLLAVQMIPTSAMFIPLFRMLASLGLINTHLGVAIAMSTLMVPFATLILRPAFLAIPVDIEEASGVDGAGPLRFLITMAVPLLRNSIIVTAAVIFVSSWAELVYPLTFLLDANLHPLSVFIAQAAGRFGATWNSLMAVATMASLPVLIIVLAAQRQLRSGLTIGAVK